MGEPAVVYDFDPRNLPPELLRAIGLMTAAAAHTESVVQQFIGAILGIDSAETLALTLHMSAPLKDHVARAMIELNATTAAVVDQVDDLLDRIEEAQERRNVLVHNSFVRHPDTGEVLSLRARARGSLLVTLQPVRIEEIEKDAAFMYEAGMDLMRFMMLWGLLPQDRTRPMRQPLNRKKKVRESRRNRSVRDAAP